MQSKSKQNASHVRLLFGAYPQKPLVKLLIAISICQKKVSLPCTQQADLRQSFSKFLGLQVPTNCVVVQLEPHNSTA